MFVFPRNSWAMFELPEWLDMNGKKAGNAAMPPIFSIKNGNFFIKLVQPKAICTRSLQVKVKVKAEMDALANVPLMTKRGGWAEIEAFFFISVNTKVMPEKMSNATT